jgi:hypothetical protein
VAQEPEYADVGTDLEDDLEVMLAAWDDIHPRTQAHVAQVTEEELRGDTSAVDFGHGTVGGILQGLAQHDLAHVR